MGSGLRPFSSGAPVLNHSAVLCLGLSSAECVCVYVCVCVCVCVRVVLCVLWACKVMVVDDLKS